MPFKIIQTIEAGEICLSIVPSGWEANGILRWPKKHLVGKLSQIETSTADDKWEKMNCVRKREFKTREEADDELDRMETRIDTEVEDIPLAPPKKRVRREPSRKVFAAKDFNNLLDTQEEFKAESNAESNPVNNACITAPVNDQQLLYVTENVHTEGIAEHNESSQIFLLPGYDGINNGNLETVLVNQRTILENQSKIMQALAKIQTGQEYAMTHCHYSASQNDAILAKRHVQHVLSPADSVDELEALERSLEDETLMQQFSCGKSYICGVTGKAQGTDGCYKLIYYFFTRKFLTQCSWTGMMGQADGNSQQEPSTCGDATTKVPLKFFKNTRALFLNLIVQADNQFSELDCDKFFKTILKNSKQRLSSKFLTSKHKNRPTKMKYNKSGSVSSLRKRTTAPATEGPSKKVQTDASTASDDAENRSNQYSVLGVENGGGYTAEIFKKSGFPRCLPR
ncbi:uncharacterized protein LOC135717572 [Ochlerotatus camptorhynchus]|uniref:uncharacterized protein LOC135717572 n=1 Tax=Ochlerotatus camptorhynchus TaxID=644619 RepID=UPI0031D02517